MNRLLFLSVACGVLTYFLAHLYRLLATAFQIVDTPDHRSAHKGLVPTGAGVSFVLTFLLTSLGFVSMHQCQRNLVGLELSFAGVEPVFAGQAAEFQVAITNHSKNHRPHLQVYIAGIVSDIDDLAAGESRVFNLEIPTQQRGRIRLDRFGVRTLFPFELFRAWAWLHRPLHVDIRESRARKRRL